ncbi:hypothetical protein [Devosia equisanguinis]|nr:hypothetical protein [Devosia equisanguinis]
MARASEQFRQSDVRLWGMVALACGGLAVFGANVAALLPNSVLGGLHQPRLAGTASVESLRSQVASLRDETVLLRRETMLLTSRFAIQEQSGSDITRRVGALEVTLPRVLEGLPNGVAVDRSNLTASVDMPGTTSFDAEGGSVVVRQTPLPALVSPAAATQPLPAPIDTQTAATPVEQTIYGIALGGPVSRADAAGQWNDLSLKIGPLLIGLEPKLGNTDAAGAQRIIAGPIENLSDARVLCERLERVSIACTPTSFSGTELNLL